VPGLTPDKLHTFNKWLS